VTRSRFGRSFFVGDLFRYRGPVIAKVGLVGGVALAWLLTFVLMGGDVMPSISAHETAGTTTSTGPNRPAPTSDPSGAPPSSSATPSQTDHLAQAAAAAEKLADGTPVAGHVLVDRPNPRRAAPPVMTFRMASFNTLGSSHTHKGSKAKRKQKASGPARTARAGRYVLDNDIDLVGFQEMQADQRNAFMGATGGQYGLYPGSSLRSMDGENSIAYRLDTWELVKADSVPIPYFGGRPRNMPVIVLKNKQSGMSAYFTNFHNPADTGEFGKQGRWRAAATSREASLFAELRTQGLPLFVTGDMNDQQSWFCAVAGPGDLKAAAGGEGARAGCSVAPGFRIDWIAGSHDVQFSNYREDRSGLVAWMTDHPVMITDVTVDAADFPKSVQQP
jgi:endonuclease/exonuclease/phosphatase family metal-dependent hydrolase